MAICSFVQATVRIRNKRKMSTSAGDTIKRRVLDAVAMPVTGIDRRRVGNVSGGSNAPVTRQRLVDAYIRRRVRDVVMKLDIGHISHGILVRLVEPKVYSQYVPVFPPKYTG